MLSVVSGYGHEAGQALSLHPDVDVITFTGSTRTGKQLLKDAGDSNMKRVWLEAGGKSANIVFADCPDLPKAAANAAAGIFYNQGQVCIAGTRLLLEESIADEFIALLKEQAKNWQPGNPLDPETTMGTLIDNTHADTVHSFIRDGEAQGTLALDGRSHVHPAAIGPTILSTPRRKPTSAAMRSSARYWSSLVLAVKPKLWRWPTTATTVWAPRSGPAICRARTA